MTDNEIRKAIGEPALLEGLAEEAVELAKEALKLARILRGENPTPADEETTRAAMHLERVDLEIYLDVLDIPFDPRAYYSKKCRMKERIREADV